MMEKLFNLLNDEEKKRVNSFKEMECCGMLEYTLLLNHAKELSFDQYYKLRKLLMMQEIVGQQPTT